MINPGTIWERPVDPPTDEEKRHGDQWDQHGVFHQGVLVVLVPRYPDLIHTEPYVDQEHQRDRDPVVKLCKDRR